MSKTAALLLLAICLFSLPAYAGKGDCAVLLHGIGRTKANMDEIREDLTDHGYNVLNIDYPSRNGTIPELAENIHPEVKKFLKGRKCKVHFVGYSLGTLVIRAYLSKHAPKKLGRFVMIAPPNKGSEVADFIGDTTAYKSFYGPAGQELRTKLDYDILLGKLKGDVGVIAGDRSIDPISSFVIDGPDDGKVSIESTKIDGMKDHITIHATHTFITTNDETVAQTRYFIENGKFKRETEK